MIPRDPAEASSRVRRWIAVCSAGALFVPLAVPLLTGTVLTQYDLSWFHLPLRFLYHQALRAGDSILWTPAIFSGFYLHGEGQVGELHPWHLVLYRLLPLGTAFNVEIASSYVLAFAGMYRLLRRFAFSRDGSCVGAMLFAFSGFNLLHFNHVNGVAICAHVPWVLLACDLMLRPSAPGERAKGFLGAALAVGSQVLLGYPQYVWMTLIAVAAFAGCRGRRIVDVALVGAAVVTGALVGGVQLAPTIDMLHESSRGELPFDFRFAFSLHPLNLVQFWSPFAYARRVYSTGAVMGHELGAYDGAFCTAAVAWVLMRRTALGSRRPLAHALLAFLALALVLALGWYGGLYQLIARAPVVGTFRAPARYLFLAHLAMSGLAALAFEDLVALASARRRVPLSKLWPLGLVATLSVVTLAIAVLLAESTSARIAALAWAPPAPVSAGTAIVVATIGLVVIAARGHASAILVLIPLVAADLGWWGYSYVWEPRPQAVADVERQANAPPAARRGEYLLPLVPPAESNYLMLAGFRLAFGYVGLPPAWRLPVGHPFVARLAGVQWKQTPAGWMPVDDSMPRARLVSDARVSAQPLADMQIIDMARTALVDTAVGPLTGRPGSVSVAIDVPGRIVVDATSDGRQLLALTERFHKGWRVRIDGRDETSLRVNGDFLGCVIGPGRHRAAFTFAPASFRTGAWLTAIGVVIAIGGSVWLRRSDVRLAGAARPRST